MGLLLARLLSENQPLILELLDWKKFYVRQIVYFPNGYCRRRCGFRDGRFRRRSASSGVQPKTYRHCGEPCGNAYEVGHRRAQQDRVVKSPGPSHLTLGGPPGLIETRDRVDRSLSLIHI